MSEIDVFLQENIWMLYAVFFIVAMLILTVFSLKNRGKIKVRIKGAVEKIVWRKMSLDKIIVIEKAKSKKVGWSISIPDGALFFTKGFLGSLQQTIDVYPHAESAIIYEYDKMETEKAVWDAKAEQNLFEASVIKAAGQTSSKIIVPTTLYILLGIILIVNIIGLLLQSGRVRFV